MSPLRQKAFKLLETAPEENLFAVIQLLQTKKKLTAENRFVRKQTTDNHLQIESSTGREEFRQLLEKKFGLKPNSAEIHKSITFITGSLSRMKEADKNKTVEDFHDERLREKYAEYFD